MPKQTIIIRDEKLRARVIGWIRAIDLDKQPWRVTVEQYRKRRSLSQNSLMWLWIGEVADYVGKHTGQDADDIHEFFKQKFLPPRIIEVGGVTVDVRSTAKLTTLEMTIYMDRIYAWVTTELGLLLPLPQEFHLSESRARGPSGRGRSHDRRSHRTQRRDSPSD